MGLWVKAPSNSWMSDDGATSVVIFLEALLFETQLNLGCRRPRVVTDTCRRLSFKGVDKLTRWRLACYGVDQGLQHVC